MKYILLTLSLSTILSNSIYAYNAYPPPFSNRYNTPQEYRNTIEKENIQRMQNPQNNRLKISKQRMKKQISKQEVKNRQRNKYFYTLNASKRGHLQAQFDLAMLYAHGIGVQKNERAAFNWLHKAARQGHLESKYYMGLSFQQGKGIRIQKSLAKYWFKLAAKAGHQKAIQQLKQLEKRRN